MNHHEPKQWSHQQFSTTALPRDDDMLKHPPPVYSSRRVTRSSLAVSQKVEAQLDFARKEFNKQRKLFIQSVPPVSHPDVREFMGDIVPSDIVISRRLQHVIISLKCSDDIDHALVALKDRTLAGSHVHLELYPRRMMLYICGIPLHYTNEQYRHFLSAYGEVEIAFLSLTRQGLSRGYGFVEFAHNRATLEKVQETLNGSRLEGNILYTGLVPDSIRGYEQTFSRTLFFVCKEKMPSVHPQLAEALQMARRLRLSDGLILYVLECSDVLVSDELWYSYRTITDHAGVDSVCLQYAVPDLSADELVTVVDSAQRKKSSVGLDNETRHIVEGLFPGQPQLVLSIESLLSQLGNQPLTIHKIIELARYLQSKREQQPSLPVMNQQISSQSTIESVRLPPPSVILETANSALHTPHGANQEFKYNGPVTRSRCMLPFNQTAGFTMEPTLQTVPLPLHAQSNRSNELSSSWNDRSTGLVNVCHTGFSNSGETGVGDAKVASSRASNVKNIRRSPRQTASQKSPVQAVGRKRRNSNRSTEVDTQVPSQSWSIWDGLGIGTGFMSYGTPVISSVAEERKENIDGNKYGGFDCEPLPKRAFRKTPGAEKRQRRLLESGVNNCDTKIALKSQENVSSVETTPNLSRTFLPGPNPSSLPIGQHCQGLGGSYVDTYLLPNRDSNR